MLVFVRADVDVHYWPHNFPPFDYGVRVYRQLSSLSFTSLVGVDAYIGADIDVGVVVGDHFLLFTTTPFLPLSLFSSTPVAHFHSVPSFAKSPGC